MLSSRNSAIKSEHYQLWFNELLFWAHFLIIAAGIVMGLFLPWWLACCLILAHRLHLKLFEGCIFSSLQKKHAALDESQDYLQQLFDRLFNVKLSKRYVKTVDRILVSMSLLVIALTAFQLSIVVIFLVLITLAIYGAFSCLMIIKKGRNKYDTSKELCNVDLSSGPSNSCTQIQNTKYSRLGGIPVEYLGVAYFMLNILLILATYIPHGSAQSLLISAQLILILAGALVSVVFILAQINILKSLCTQCMNVHGASICIFLLQSSRWIMQ